MPRKSMEQTHEPPTWVVRSLRRKPDEPLTFEMKPKGGVGPVITFEVMDKGFGHRPEVREVRVTAQGRGLLTSDLSRLNVDRMLRLAAEAVGGGEAMWRDAVKPGRPVKVDRTLLEQVAQVVAENPQAPRKAVMAAFGVAERQATNYINKAAEDRGLAKLMGREPK